MNVRKRPILLAALLVPWLAACDTAEPEMDMMAPTVGGEIESAEMANSATELSPSEFEDATGSYGM